MDKQSEVRELERILEQVYRQGWHDKLNDDINKDIIIKATQAILKDYVRRERVEKLATTLANNCYKEGAGELDTTIVIEMDKFLNALHSQGKEKLK